MRNPFSLPSILPKRLVQPGRAAVAANITARLLEASAADGDTLYTQHGSSASGLSQEEAEQRLEKHGANAVAQEASSTDLNSSAATVSKNSSCSA